MQYLLDMHLHLMQIMGMTFDQFLADNKISNAIAAEKLARDATLIGRYRARQVTPSPQIIAEIVEWSKGKISPRELLAEKAPEAAE